MTAPQRDRYAPQHNTTNTVNNHAPLHGKKKETPHGGAITEQRQSEIYPHATRTRGHTTHDRRLNTTATIESHTHHKQESRKTTEASRRTLQRHRRKANDTTAVRQNQRKSDAPNTLAHDNTGSRALEGAIPATASVWVTAGVVGWGGCPHLPTLLFDPQCSRSPHCHKPAALQRPTHGTPGWRHPAGGTGGHPQVDAPAYPPPLAASAALPSPPL